VVGAPGGSSGLSAAMNPFRATRMGIVDLGPFM
jgi:hypothetical protein